MSTPLTPPSSRTPLWAEITKAAKERRFTLQVCASCATVQYPPREVCRSCLSDRLDWSQVDPDGTVLTCTELHVSSDPFFQNHMPWVMGTVHLDCGPVIFAHLAPGAHKISGHVTMINRLDPSGQGVFIALPKSAHTPPQDFDFADLLTGQNEEGKNS